jgi:hypothetical protein
MLEIGTSGLMSGEGKRAIWHGAFLRLYPPLEYAAPLGRLIENVLVRAASAFARNVVQICPRQFKNAIIPFIPLTADLENGHEESGVRLPCINALDA